MPLLFTYGINRFSHGVALFYDIFPTIFQKYSKAYHNVPKFHTDRSGQTVQTQNQSDQGLHCFPFHLHIFDAFRYGKATFYSNFRMITTIFWVSEYLGILQLMCSRFKSQQKTSIKNIK